MTEHSDIRIGALAGKGRDTANYIRQILPHGFESFQINFWKYLGDVDLKKLAREVKQVLDEGGNKAVISSLGLFGNPIEDKRTAADWKRCIDACADFGCDLVCGFAGCLTNEPVDKAIKPWKKTWAPLVKRAEDKGVRLAMENCDMHGTWERANFNIAHSPAAWEMMFNEIPSKHLGLEWEPAHQLVSLVDPLPQLRKWVHKVFHLHGKDATLHWDVVRTYGIRGGKEYVLHRHPGFGDTNWTDIISILRMGGFKGSIDIEGWHDPVYKGDLEMTGQVRALHYLKQCRGGDFVPNPK